MPSDPLPRRLFPALFHPWTWRMAWRDSRTQRRRLAVFSSSIIAGIAALVAIHSLKSSVQSGIDAQAKTLLGSDLHIASRQPFPEPAADLASALADAVARETSFASMLTFPDADAARLVQVRAVESGYPFYGTVETLPPGAWTAFASAQRAPILLEPALLDQFDVRPGSVVRLGEKEFEIAGSVLRGAPRAGRFSGFAPEAYIRLQDLAGTGLTGPRSLARYHLHLRAPVSAAAIRMEFDKTFPKNGWRFETPEDRRDTLGDALDNFQQFLSLLALSALVLGAIGVAGAIHAHVSRRVASVAVLRCLGCSSDLAFAVFLAQAAALGAAGALCGALLGAGLHAGTVALFQDDLPVALSLLPPPGIVLATASAGFAVCCGFAWLPLLRVRHVSPAAALREDPAAGRTPFFAALPVFLILGGLLLGLAFLGAPDWKRAGGMVLGLGVAFLLLAGTAKLLAAAARAVLRPSWPYLLRQGISNLYRPHNQTLLFLLSLGLGTFLLVTLLLARNQMLGRIDVAAYPDSPNIYLVDVQADQVSAVTGLLQSQSLPALEIAPMVTMRLKSVRGVPVAELEEQEEVPRWVLRREFRSTYRDTLGGSESLAAGEWFQGSSQPGEETEVSLEVDIARDLGVGVGDRLLLDVQGVDLPARITSLRDVDWSRFHLNFFMVFPPGSLEGAPGFHVVTTRVPEGRSSGELQRDLAKELPNVSAIDLTLILATVRSLLERLGRVIQILAGFTLAAGGLILAGALMNGKDQRVRESALLRTLGASAAQVRRILVVEYAALGALSGTAGVLLATGANAALAIWVFKADPWPDPVLLVVPVVAVTALSVLAGMGFSRGVCGHPPLEVLREEGSR